MMLGGKASAFISILSQKVSSDTPKKLPNLQRQKSTIRNTPKFTTKKL
jgi:hypothetical protein